MDLVAAAAFTAAALSLVNVGVSAWFNSRGHLEEWRRGVERPIVAQITTLSDDALKAWQDAKDARQEWIHSLGADPTQQHEDAGARDRASEQWTVGSGIYDKLRFEMAQLDLIAGPPLRRVASMLLQQHAWIQHHLRLAGGADDWFDLVTNLNNEIVKLKEDLVVKTRADLGLDRGTLLTRALGTLDVVRSWH